MQNQNIEYPEPINSFIVGLLEFGICPQAEIFEADLDNWKERVLYFAEKTTRNEPYFEARNMDKPKVTAFLEQYFNSAEASKIASSIVDLSISKTV